MLGILAIAAAGFLFAAPAAHAQVTEIADGPYNGVTCYQRVGGSYPEDGHFFYCGSNSTSKTLVLNQLKDILSNKSNVDLDLDVRHSIFYVFETPMDKEAYFVDDGDPNGVLSQKQQDFYTEMRNRGGLTEGPGTGGTSITYILEKSGDATSTYPSVNTFSSAELQYLAAHEMGHAYDYGFVGSPAVPSKSAEFRRVLSIDREYMFFNSINGRELETNYAKYFLNENYSQELFAEIFAGYAPSTAVGDITGARGAVINPYFECTSAYVESIVDNHAEPTTLQYPAHCRKNFYTINCEEVKEPTSSNPDWPWGADVLRCGTATQQGANGMWGTLNGYSATASKAFLALKHNRARFYFFRNPSEYHTYMDERIYPHTMPTHPREWGVTNLDTGNDVPVMTAIFERDLNNNPINNANGTAHHAGLWMDRVQSSLSAGSRISDSSLFQSQMTEDWGNFNALPNCKNTGSSPYGVFRAYRDRDGLYICNTVVNATVGGTPQAGNAVTITITDASLSPSPQAVSYTVMAGNTTTDVATALAAAINANTNLSSADISATSSGNSVSITTASGNATTFAKTTTGSTTLSLPNPQYGRGGALASKYSGKTNKAVLETAHPHIFDDTRTIYAEVTADETGNTNGTNQGYDQYVNEFTCMKLFENRVIKQGRLPTTQELTNASCPTQ